MVPLVTRSKSILLERIDACCKYLLTKSCILELFSQGGAYVSRRTAITVPISNIVQHLCKAVIVAAPKLPDGPVISFTTRFRKLWARFLALWAQTSPLVNRKKIEKFFSEVKKIDLLGIFWDPWLALSKLVLTSLSYHTVL